MNLNLKIFGYISGIVLSVILGLTFFQQIKAEDNAKAKPIVLKINTVEAAAPNTAVNFTFENNGKKSSFKELTKGKVVLLNVWGTWCPPCRRELPDIIELQNDLKDKKFIVVGLAMEQKNNPDPYKTVCDFADKQGFNYINFVMNDQLKASMGDLSLVPTTFIIDQNGRIVEKIVGMKSKDVFMAAIKRVLK